VVGAPSSIGVRPYDDGMVRHMNRAPQVLRERGLVARLRADDLGDVAPPSYHDFVQPRHRPRNEQQLVAYSKSLGARVYGAIAHGRFGLVLGGDCSVVLACLLAAKHKAAGPVGLLYLDAHADFSSPEESRTGSAASMSLSFATGRIHSPLARLGGRAPLVDAHRVVLVGRRDRERDGDGDGHAALTNSSVLDLPGSRLLKADWLELAGVALDRVAPSDARGFWIQVDADVLNPSMMPAVDSPEPGGPTPSELVRLLAPLVRHPRALGLSLTVYDPALDPDRSCARRLVNMLEALLAPPITH